MATFNIQLNLSPETVKVLRGQGYSLYGFKAVAADSGGAPTVWFKLDSYLTNTLITWEDKYEGYNSTSQITENSQIIANNKIQTNLGDLISIEQGSGNLTNSSNGDSGTVAFLNLDSQQFTVGISQLVNGQGNILCAFPILGSGSTRLITPISKVALIFSTESINSGVVITKAMSSGAIIDLTVINSRTVDFSLNNGWTANGAYRLVTFNAFDSLSNLLIEPQR